MNNVILRKRVMTAQYEALTSKAEEIATVAVSASPTNAANVIFRGEGGAEVPWTPGESHLFRHINLADLQVKGTPGDIVTVVGYAGGMFT